MLGLPFKTIGPEVIVVLRNDQPGIVQKHNVVGDLHRGSAVYLQRNPTPWIVIAGLYC